MNFFAKSNRWNKVYTVPTPIEWTEYYSWFDVIIHGECVASLEKRPPYCDRGHFYVKCYLPDLDEADMFPRYYMDEEVAKQETEKFLKWRLWKQRS